MPLTKQRIFKEDMEAGVSTAHCITRSDYVSKSPGTCGIMPLTASHPGSCTGVEGLQLMQ
jgi:hypothetical protein